MDTKYLSHNLNFITASDLSFLRHPLDQIINNHQTATFNCLVNGSNSIDVIWEKDGRHFRNGNITINKMNDNTVSSILILNRATVSDGGKYRCNATNADNDKSVSKEAELISNYLVKA